MEEMTIEQQQALAMASARLRLQSTQSNGIPGPRMTGSVADQIPGYGKPVPTSTAAPVRPESDFLGKLMSPIETAVTLGTSAVTAPIVEAAKIGGTLFSGKYGTQAGIKAGEETGRKVQQFFQPAVSPESEAQTQAISNFLSSTGLQGVPMNVLGDLSRGMTPALRAASDATRAPMAARAAKIQEANVAQSYANAPMIEAAQSAQRIGGAVPPAISNPTKANVIKGKLVGPELEQQFAKKNEIAVTEKVRQDLGVKPTEKLIPEIDASGKLNPNSPITRALDEASKPYEPIRKMESLVTPKESVAALEELKKQAPIGGDAKTAAINGIIDDALTKLQKTTSGPFSGVGGGPVVVGRSGAAMLDDIRSLRRDAQATYRAQKINPDPLAIAKADTQISIANILEDVIDANAPSPKILSELRGARTRIAQIYEHERAINYGQQKIDPQVYAKLFEERKGGMTGLNADIAKAAAMFPDYFTLTPAELKSLPRITRGGLGAAIGAVIGSPLGPAGALAGTAAGMGVGGAASGLAARRMATPAYQATNAMPKDYRPATNMLRPVEPNATPNGLVPYDYSQQTTQAPNFVLRSGQEAPAYQPPSYPQLTQFGDFATTQKAFRGQEARAAERSRTAGQQAEAQQAAAEAAARKPAGRGVELVFDAAGNLVEAPTAKGAGGAMPTALESAVAKMAGEVVSETTGTAYKTQTISPKTGAKPYTRITKRGGETTFGREGQAFAMTAEEKIAWNKAKANLTEAAPEYAKLSDQEIVRRMTDVKISEELLVKAREKARAFEDIAARAGNDRARQAALVKREQMLDLAEQLQDALGSRPVKRGGQGPKTRAFQRNMLAPEQEIQNALATRIDLTGMANGKK
jgi:hypothetical protein